MELGTSLRSFNAAERYGAAVQAQFRHGLKPQCVHELSDAELVERLRLLLTNQTSSLEQKAILGLVDKPTLSMMDAFERFWAHIEDEWTGLSHDQHQVIPMA